MGNRKDIQFEKFANNSNKTVMVYSFILQYSHDETLPSPSQPATIGTLAGQRNQEITDYFGVRFNCRLDKGIKAFIFKTDPPNKTAIINIYLIIKKNYNNSQAKLYIVYHKDS